MESDAPVGSEIRVLEDILNNGNLVQVQQFTQTDKFSGLLKREGSELISSISTLLNNKALFKSVENVARFEEILRVVVDGLDPNDSFITLLEQLDEDSCSIEKFVLFLPPLILSLQKLAESRKNWLEWALSTVEQYVDALSPPEDHQPDNDEKMLTEHPYLDSILALCKALFSLFKAFVHTDLSEREKDALTAFGLQILTKPTMYVYAEKLEEVQQLQADVIANINILSSNLHFCLNYLDERCMSNLEKNELEVLKEGIEDTQHYLNSLDKRCEPNSEKNELETLKEVSNAVPLTLWGRISPLNLAVYYYALISEPNFLQYFPHVYEKLYLFHKLLLLCVILLRHTHNAVIKKGLFLSTRLLSSMMPTSISHRYLVYRVHPEFIRAVSKISRYSSIYENRQEAFQLLLSYIRLFDARGRYMIYLNISSLTDSPDVDGEIITSFRNEWRLNFTAGTLEFYHRGKHLIDLLKSFGTLPDLKSNDLSLYKSKILAFLHLFALLVKQDAKNLTGVGDHFEYFEKRYFSPLIQAVKKSREEYHQQLHYLKNDEPSSSSRKEISFSIEVGGQQVSLREEQKIEAIGSAVTALDMIELALNLLYEYANRDVSPLMLSVHIDSQTCFPFSESSASRTILVSGLHTHLCLYNDEEAKKLAAFDNLKAVSSANQNNTMSAGSDETEEGNHSEQDKEYEDNIKNKILEASLNFVAEHGWTKAAIVAGAKSMGYPGVVSEMFPLGGSNLVLYFYSQCNARLAEYLENRAEEKPPDPDKQEYIKLFIYDAVEKRLRMITPYIDKWPQAMATLTLSRAVPSALSNLLTLVDDICYYAGDRSVDLDWYLRRIALAGIYKVTELYMLQDKSPDYENTWKFLRKQLDDATSVYSCIQQSEQASQLTKDVCLATFTTARNILGMNWKR